MTNIENACSKLSRNRERETGKDTPLSVHYVTDGNIFGRGYKAKSNTKAIDDIALYILSSISLTPDE